MKNKLFLSICLALLFPDLINAQGIDAFLPQTKEPSATQFMRYGEIPVDYSSGVPKIEIPIYTLKTKYLDIPISISYHAGGHKVADVPGPVGLGWVLNAGGMISQTFYGLNDSPNPAPFVSASEAQQLINRRDEYESAEYWITFMTKYPNKDTMSDRYYYNFGNHTGIFRRDMATKEMKTIPYDPIKIEEAESSFKITDTKGNIWFFELLSGSLNHYEYYVKYIQFPGTTDKIEFEYTRSDIDNIVVLSESSHYGEYENSESIVNYIWNENGAPLYKNERNPIGDTPSIPNTLLSKIKWKSTQISFNYIDDRLDRFKKRINSITITYEGTQTNKISFINKDQYLGNSRDNYRLLLKGLVIDGKKYTFKYKENIIMPSYTPDISRQDNTLSGDFWGYFNGYYGPREIIPFVWNGSGREIANPQYRPNREPNPLYTQAGIIEEITYPTGGKTIFQFEQNKGTNVYRLIGRPINNNEEYFGGLRIKQLVNMEGNDTLNIKTYEYQGGPTQQISTDHFIYQQHTFYNSIVLAMYGFAVITSEMARASTTGIPTKLGVPALHYHTVIEYFGTPEKNIGKKEYYYDRQPYNDYGGCGPIYDFNGPQYIMNYYGCDYGQRKAPVKTIKEYEFSHDTYHIKKETTNDYTTISKGSFITGVEFHHVYTFLSFYSGAYFSVGPYGETAEYFWPNLHPKDNYGFEITNPLLISSTVNSYENNGVISSTTNYAYDMDGRILAPTEISTINSDGKNNKETFTFPFNYNTSPYTHMVRRNMVSPVISKTNSTGNNSFTVKYDYEEDRGKYVIDAIKTGKNNNLEQRIKFHRYDQYGNPLFITKDNEMNIVYIWSYSGQYLIAEIKNATYNQVSQYLNIESYSSTANPNFGDMDAIHNLSVSIPDILITTFIYEPLIGIAYITDPSGKRTQYAYDSFGRLKDIYRMKGITKEVLESYEYNYVNQ